MADPVIKIKRSAVADKIPTPDQLPLGEVALNTYDGYLYASKNVGIGTTVIAINPFRVGTGTDSYNAYFTAGNIGIGSTQPTSKLTVSGDGLFTGVVTASSFSGSGINLTGIVTSIVAGSNITISGSTGQVTINSSGSSSTKNVNTYTATEGQTTFSANYSVGYIDVYLNGVKLSQHQYTATNGTSIVLIDGASLDDVVEIVGFVTNITTSALGIATAGGTVGTGVTLLDFRGAGISTVTVSSGMATINIEGGGSSTPEISPVMMSMIF